MAQEIYVNEIIRDVVHEKTYRVLWISMPVSFLYWISLDNAERIPKKLDVAEVRAGLESGDYVASGETENSLIVEDELADEAKAHRDRIWNMLKDALEKEPDIYEPKPRAALLRMVAQENGMRANNLYPYLAKYWKRGKTPNAFLPDYRNCGRSRDYEKGGYKKLGRPPRNGQGFGKVLKEDDFHNFDKAVRKYYLTKKEMTFRSVYERLLADSYTVEVTKEQGVSSLQLLPEDEIPSISQFRYWYQKNKNLKTEIQKRKGDTKYNLTSRSILGKSDYGLMGPGSQYQIDATVGDIYLVSQFDRSNIIGRPVMYFVIDAFSRMVTGMYVGLEGPSWVGAMMAIANAASDKTAYCREYGISITEEEWPCHHIPSAILGDRGEMESRNADNLVSMLGIRIENTPPYRADLKGIIEQHFRTINANATVMLPGRVKPDMAERGGEDYRLDAKLDIRQFTAVIIKCILYYNNSHYMDSFEKSRQMMEAGVEAVPVKLWNWGIRYCSGALRVMPEEKVRLALMPTDNATATSQGLRFKWLYYSSKELADGLWFEKARSKGSYRVKVSYDPRDMGTIYAWDKTDGTPILCSLLDWEGKYSGKQLGEIQYEHEKEKMEKKRHQAKETEAKINLGKEIDSIIEEAEQMADPADGRSKAERLSGMKQNRRDEREYLKKKEAFTGSNKETGEPQCRQSTEEVSPALQMIKRKMEGRIKDESLYGKGTLPGTGDTRVPREPHD